MLNGGKKRFLQVGLIVIASFALLGAGDDARFEKLGHEMMCACGCNQILLECNHVGCQYSDRMRGELLAALQRGDGGGGGSGGDSDSLVLQSFVQKYGTTVLAAPTTSGFNWVAWIMPFLVFGSALFFTVLIVRAWSKRPEPAPVVTTTLSRDDLETYRQRADKETDL